VPTDAYGLDEAVKDGYLAPPRAVSVPVKFIRQGLRYDDLSEDEKEQWDVIEWDEDGNVPRQVDPPAINKWLFNADTVDKVLEHLMTHGLKVAAGDRLGKTIIFAKNHDHAQFIAQRFDANYPHLKGSFARVIDFKTDYAQSLLEDFCQADKAPHVAISVDMLDTGIDVPEVVNLVFFKIARSKTKFWQMLGRGTRLCPDLFGPGQNKEFFYVFDFCQNFEFFNQNPQLADGAIADSLAKRLFVQRVALIGELEKRKADADALITLRRNGGSLALRSYRHDPRQLHRPSEAPLRRALRRAGCVGESDARRSGGSGATRRRPAFRSWRRRHRRQAVRSARPPHAAGAPSLAPRLRSPSARRSSALPACWRRSRTCRWSQRSFP
jgi:type I restriction enzyme R subunit